MAKKDKLEYDLWEAEYQKNPAPGKSNLTGKTEHFALPIAAGGQAPEKPGAAQPQTKQPEPVYVPAPAAAGAGETRQAEVLPRVGGTAASFSYEAAPEYVSPYQAQIDEALRAYLDRAPFAYDPETDPQYAAYRKQYAREGQRAAEDTLGRYAAMTGGMPSTAAVTAAQQAGDYYAAQMADKIPELYQAAYRMYADEGDRLLQGLGALRGAESDSFSRYRTRLGQYNADRGYDTELWRYGVEDARYADEAERALAQLAAKYGDYRGLQALGVDVLPAAGKSGGTSPGAKTAPASAAETAAPRTLNERVNDGIEDDKATVVDMESVLALNRGRLSAEALADLEAEGKIESYRKDGRIYFRNV